MDVGVGILFLAVLCAEIVLLPVWAAAILSISGDIVDNIIELLDLENMSVAVGILSVGVLELEITLRVFYSCPIIAHISNTRLNTEMNV